MITIKQTKENIIKEIDHFIEAWQQWPGEPYCEGREMAMRMARLIVEREFAKLEGQNNE